MLKASRHSWWISSYQKSKYWKEIKKPSKLTDLKAGDVLFTETHAMLYIGGGKIIEATSGGGNPAASKDAWAKSIHITDYTASRFKSVTNVFRFTGSINTTAVMKYGEVSARVYLLQAYLNWYTDGEFFKECGSADGIFGDNTLKYVKKMQKGLGVTVDGEVGPNTIAAMRKAVK